MNQTSLTNFTLLNCIICPNHCCTWYLHWACNYPDGTGFIALLTIDSSVLHELFCKNTAIVPIAKADRSSQAKMGNVMIVFNLPDLVGVWKFQEILWIHEIEWLLFCFVFYLKEKQWALGNLGRSKLWITSEIVYILNWWEKYSV